MLTRFIMQPLNAAIVVLATALAQPAIAQTVQSAGSEIQFVSRQMGVPVEGQFKKWSAQVQFDPKTPQASKIAFTVDMGSASLGVKETDAELVKADWFHTVKFPQAQFQSTAVKATAPGRLEVTGNLTIKGATQAVTVPVTLTQSGTGAQRSTVAQGQFAIKRLTFKIGEGAWSDTSMVADDVQVRFKIILAGVAPL
jgi:polyisoprenoid-binding protein YceI